MFDEQIIQELQTILSEHKTLWQQSTLSSTFASVFHKKKVPAAIKNASTLLTEIRTAQATLYPSNLYPSNWLYHLLLEYKEKTVTDIRAAKKKLAQNNQVYIMQEAKILLLYHELTEKILNAALAMFLKNIGVECNQQDNPIEAAILSLWHIAFDHFKALIVGDLMNKTPRVYPSTLLSIVQYFDQYHQQAIGKTQGWNAVDRLEKLLQLHPNLRSQQELALHVEPCLKLLGNGGYCTPSTSHRKSSTSTSARLPRRPSYSTSHHNDLLGIMPSRSISTPILSESEESESEESEFFPIMFPADMKARTTPTLSVILPPETSSRSMDFFPKPSKESALMPTASTCTRTSHTISGNR